MRNWEPNITPSIKNASPVNDRFKNSIRSEYEAPDDEENKEDGKRAKKAMSWKQYLKDEKVEIDILNFERNRSIYKMDETYNYSGYNA